MDSDLKSLKVSVMSSEATFFDGKAEAVSAVNEKGPFDILPLHENFISIIKDRLRILDQSGKTTELKLDTGVIKAHNNVINIFLGIGTDKPLTTS